MPKSQLTSCCSSPSLIDRPACPKCAVRMSFVRARSGTNGFDLLYFECSKCVQVLTLSVSNDPIRSNAARWVESANLTPPR